MTGKDAFGCAEHDSPIRTVPDRALMVSIVVPCYFEEDALVQTIPTLANFLAARVEEGLASPQSEIIFIDDGSADGTWDRICAAHAKSHVIKGIRLAANAGHQNALLAGYEQARGQFIISIDADLQDDVEVMRDMLVDARNGVDIVYGVREARNTDTFFKRFTAEGFYKLMALFGVDLVFNHADYRGMSRRALNALLQYREKSLFLRGLVPKLGFRTSKVFYNRKERSAGETKYPLRKMLAFAIHGITSTSFVPLRIVTLLGLGLFLFSMVVLGWIIWIKFFTERAIPGWASTLIPQTVFSGMQLLCLGIIGEYMAVIFNEVKDRPRFHVAEITDDTDGSANTV
ncbi:MAG: glycosyltransferase family 2 protein [Planctomycetaceae bacterium]|nr:glycosyltransferase family 2 protein [Planctomycetaceae bacterium]